MHKSVNELRKAVEFAAKRVEVGASYAHYKNLSNIYIVKGICILEATDEPAVEYVAIKQPDIIFVRPLADWLETVDGKPRFTKVENRGEV